MFKVRNIKLFIFVWILIFGINHQGYCDTTYTVQGVEIVQDISKKIQLSVDYYKNQKNQEAKEMFEQAWKSWQSYIAFQTKVFAGEITQSEELNQITTDLAENWKEIIEKVEENKIDDARTGLESIKLSVDKLLEAIALPVLLDFTGAKCKACKIMKARLEKIVKEFNGKVRIVTVDVNKEKDLTKEFKIMIVPTLVFINREGKEVVRFSGEMEERALKAKLNKLFEEKEAIK